MDRKHWRAAILSRTTKREQKEKVMSESPCLSLKSFVFNQWKIYLVENKNS